MHAALRRSAIVLGFVAHRACECALTVEHAASLRGGTAMRRLGGTSGASMCHLRAHPRAPAPTEGTRPWGRARRLSFPAEPGPGTSGCRRAGANRALDRAAGWPGVQLGSATLGNREVQHHPGNGSRESCCSDKAECEPGAGFNWCQLVGADNAYGAFLTRRGAGAPRRTFDIDDRGRSTLRVCRLRRGLSRSAAESSWDDSAPRSTGDSGATDVPLVCSLRLDDERQDRDPRGQVLGVRGLPCVSGHAELRQSSASLPGRGGQGPARPPRGGAGGSGGRSIDRLGAAEAKKSELEDDVARMTSRLDRAVAKSARLKAEIKVLDSELAALAKDRANVDKIRQEENADFTAAKSDLELGLTGVRKALDLPRDYYGGAAAAMLQDDSKFGAYLRQPAPPVKHDKSSGAGGSIIDILEVCESDFATNLAKEEAEEADAQLQYEKVSQEDAVTKTTKQQDVKYKTQEAKSQDKTAAEYTSDRATTNTELSAVLEYYDQVKERCTAKPETYEDRKARREGMGEGESFQGQEQAKGKSRGSSEGKGLSPSPWTGGGEEAKGDKKGQKVKGEGKAPKTAEQVKQHTKQRRKKWTTTERANTFEDPQGYRVPYYHRRKRVPPGQMRSITDRLVPRWKEKRQKGGGTFSNQNTCLWRRAKEPNFQKQVSKMRLEVQKAFFRHWGRRLSRHANVAGRAELESTASIRQA